MVGFVGGPGKAGSALDPLARVFTVRGIYVGSKALMIDMNRAIEAHNIKPVIDKTTFDFEHTKEAYQHQIGQKHFGECKGVWMCGLC